MFGAQAQRTDADPMRRNVRASAHISGARGGFHRLINTVGPSLG